MVINPWNLDALEELETEYDTNVYTVLQLRLLPSLRALKKNLEEDGHRERVKVNLHYITRRGQWYHSAWKGNAEKSGGVAMNIGVHFFDLLIWPFGDIQGSELELSTASKTKGSLVLDWADVDWFLSVDGRDLPEETKREGKCAYRSMTINGQEIEFSTGFPDLHTKSYEEILAGRGFCISEARKSIELVYKVRQQGRE